MSEENHAAGPATVELTDTATGPAVLPERDETKESFDRITPIVWQILDLVCKERPAIGNNTHEQDDAYFPLAEKVLEFMRDGDMKYMEKENTFALLLQPFDKIRTIVLGSLNKSANKAVDLKMGKQFGEVTIKDLDAILKAEVIPSASEQG